MAYDTVTWHKPVALIVGSEAEGAGAEAHKLAADRYVHIPMSTGVESLNAAVAAGILLFAIARQVSTI
jgi:tRNA G18 (ribose-2'-O)-methylase SpoU